MENYSWSNLEWSLHYILCYPYEPAKMRTGLRTQDWVVVDLYPNLVTTRSLFHSGSQASTVPRTFLRASESGLQTQRNKTRKTSESR